MCNKLEVEFHQYLIVNYNAEMQLETVGLSSQNKIDWFRQTF